MPMVTALYQARNRLLVFPTETRGHLCVNRLGLLKAMSRSPQQMHMHFADWSTYYNTLIQPILIRSVGLQWGTSHNCAD